MRRPFAHLSNCLVTAVLMTAARATTREQVVMLFKPFLAEQVTLSPDGSHVAYTEHVKDELDVVILALAEPYAKVRIAVEDDTDVRFSQEKRRSTLRFLRWAGPNRLVFAPREELVGPAGPRQKHFAPIFAIDADGKNPRTLLNGPDLVGQINNPATFETDDRPRFSRIVGFPAGARDHLLVQALGDTLMMQPPSLGVAETGGPHAPSIAVPVMLPTTLFKVDVRTGKLDPLGDEFLNGELGYDWQGRSRISYAKPFFSLERPFAIVGSPELKFDEPWLGPLAGHFTTTPQNYFGERAFPLGFDPDPNVLYFASNVGRDTFGVYALNLITRQRTDLALELAHVDLTPLEPDYPSRQLVFDEARGQLAGVRSPGPQPITVWRDPELAAAQRTLEKKFPQRTVELLEWSDDRAAFLLRVTGGTEPGRYFVWQKPDNLVLEILRSAPWLDASNLHMTESFAFDTADGIHLTGYVTLPRTTRLNPPPAVICFADGFPARPHAEFDREAQVLAEMGLIVIRLNHRGVGGFGRAHRDAILAGLDRAPIDDALATLDWIAARHSIDRKRVATLGHGFGGYLAVRALELRPDAFRCAVADNAPLAPGRWLQVPPTTDMGQQVDFTLEANRAFLQRSGADLAALAVLAQPDLLTHAVFQIVNAGRSDAIETTNREVRSHLKKIATDSDYVEVNAAYTAGLPEARMQLYARLEVFFNLNLYDYKVKVGETKEIK